MKTVIHKSQSRGYADHGWLKSHHTFSFAGYYNPERTRFGTLRVLNDDIIAGGTGFGKHPHDNMEIISIPIYGALEHEDSMGNKHVVHDNEIQVMSAGSGVYHSEYNHLKDKDSNFLQVWIFPKEKDIEPRYSQKDFDEKDLKNTLKLLVSPEKNGEALWINQNAFISMSELEKGNKLEYKIKSEGNGMYLFLIEGKLNVNDNTLEKRDAIGIYETAGMEIEALENSKFVIFEVPMS